MIPRRYLNSSTIDNRDQGQMLGYLEDRVKALKAEVRRLESLPEVRHVQLLEERVIALEEQVGVLTTEIATLIAEKESR